VNENPTHLDLFSGIGGFALAAGWAGFETVGFCDNEPYAQAVLKKHWPNVPIHEDIKMLDGTAYRGVTLLSGGFPCQPFSNAGKRRGKDDDRYLWPQMLRVIQEARPAWIVGENVVGIIGLALDQVCSDLEACGYEVEPIIIPACGVDAPHRRDRIWIVGNSKFNGHFAGESGGGLLHKSKKQTREIEERQSSGASGSSENVADSKCDAEGGTHGSKEWGCVRGRQDEDISQRNKMGCNSSDSRENVADTESSQSRQQAKRQGREDIRRGSENCAGIEDSRREAVGERSGEAIWLAEPNVGRVANGIPNSSHRLKGLGNAIVPQVAYQIIKGIRELL
jgi:DNA (cytosine-5)-methyltransferase 1